MARNICEKVKKSIKAIAGKGKTARKLAMNYAGWLVGSMVASMVDTRRFASVDVADNGHKKSRQSGIK